MTKTNKAVLNLSNNVTDDAMKTCVIYSQWNEFCCHFKNLNQSRNNIFEKVFGKIKPMR